VQTQHPILDVVTVNRLCRLEPHQRGILVFVDQPQGTDLHPGDPGGDHDDQFEEVFEEEIGGDGLTDVHQGLDIVVVSLLRRLFHGYFGGKN
jgi:hypothetical protein